MCIGDWRLGRLIRTKRSNFSTSGSSNLSYPANQQRVGITFLLGGAEGNDVSLATAGFNGIADFSATGTISPSIAVGLSIDGKTKFALTHNNNPFHLTLATHGDVPTLSFLLSTLNGTAVGTVIEYFMPEEYIAAAMEQFRSQYGIAGY